MLKHLFKYFLTSVLLILLLLSLLSIYINHLYLSKDGKLLAQKQLEDITGTRVFFKNISYDLFNGIVFKNLIITDPLDDKQIIFFAERAEMRIILTDIIKGKYIINRLTLSSFELFIRKDAKGVVNLSGIKTSTAPGIIPNIRIKDGKIHYEDLSYGAKRAFSLANVKGSIAPSIKGYINFELSGSLNKGRYRNIMLVGNHNIFSDKLLLKILGKKIDITLFNEYVKDFSDINLKKGSAKINFQVEAVSFSKANIFGKYDLDGLEAENDNFSLSGNCHGMLKTSGKSGSGKNLIGRISLDDCSCFIKKRPMDIRNICGDFFFNAGGFLTKNLSFSFLQHSFNAEITAADLKKPFYNITLKTTLENDWGSSAIFKNYIRYNNLKISGPAELSAYYKGFIEDLSPENLSALIELNGINVNCPCFTKEARDIRGKISYVKNVFSSDSLTGNLSHKFNFKGSFNTKDKKRLAFEADYPDTRIAGNIVFTEDAISIEPLEIRRMNSDLTLNGLLTDMKSPSYNLSIEGNIDLRDLLSLDKLKEYALPVCSNSRIFIKGSAKGKKSESKNLTIEADFSSDALTYRKMELKGISGKIKYTPEKAAIEFSAKNVCSGSLTGNIFVSFKNGPPASFTLENRIKDMQLEEFFNTIFDKKQNVRGKTDFHIKLWGLAGKPETFDGEGRLTISDGRLWDMKLFDGIWQILVITNPDLKKAVFTEADLEFKIKKQKVFIPDAVFSSEHFLLMPKGYIGFDKKIDFSIESGFFEGSEDSGVDVLAKRIGNIKCRLTTIHATGSIEKPILKTEMRPLSEIFR